MGIKRGDKLDEVGDRVKEDKKDGNVLVETSTNPGKKD